MRGFEGEFTRTVLGDMVENEMSWKIIDHTARCCAYIYM
jgi:hypothetical protein